MAPRHLWALAVVALFWLLSARPALADTPTVDEIARQLTCQCGCNSVLNNCVHQECQVRSAMKAQIQQGLSQGKSSAEIIQGFVAQYGEVVLSAPTKRGFNLTAWVLPFTALLAGAGVVYWALTTWVWRGKTRGEAALPPQSPADEEYRRRLEQELDAFGQEEGRL